MKRVDVYLRGKITPEGIRIPPQFSYLAKSPIFGTFYLPLMARYKESLLQQLKTPTTSSIKS